MNKVLVTFGTMSGSTRDVAEAIGEEFRDAGFDTVVAKANQISSVEDYSTVIAGSPIMGGLINGQCKKFLKQHRRALKSKKVAYFITCGTISDPTDENIKLAKKYLLKLMKLTPWIDPIDTAIFAGGLKSDGEDFDEANFLLKFIIPKIIEEFTDASDFVQIRTWAKELTKKVS